MSPLASHCRLAILGVFALTACLVTPAQGASRRKTLVSDLENPSGLPLSELAAASELLRSELAASAELQIIGPRDVADLLALDKSRQLMGCEDGPCLDSLASLAGVTRLVSGSLAVLTQRDGPARTLIQLRLIDTARATVLRRVSHVSEGRDLLAATRLAARTLLQEVGTLHLINQVAGAEVFLNGKRLGVMPLQPFAVEQLGEAELRVDHVDHLPYQAKVEIAPGVTTRHALRLRSYLEVEQHVAAQRAWGWTALAGAVLSAGASAACFGLASKDYDAYRGVDLRATSVRELDDLKRQVELKSTVGWVTAGVGAALLGTSVALLLTAGSEAPRVAVGAGPDGASVAVAGRF